LDNAGVARILRETADLLEIKGENPFKIRAYRNAADVAANHPHHLTALEPAELMQIPGIGKDLAARIREIGDTGDTAFHRELVAEFPPSVLDLLGLQGVGPKTVATLYRDLGIRTLDDLAQAAASGRLRAIKGMGAKKEALILKALEERQRHAGRHLLPDSQATADAMVAFLRDTSSALRITPVGSLRRGCETCGDLDLLAAAPDEAGDVVMEAFTNHPLAERVLARGSTKSSILTSGGFQIDLRLVEADSYGAALQYFTGSKAHNILLRDRAIGLGLKLNEYGVFRTEDGVKIAGSTEEDVYEALGLRYTPPELREARGEIEAAAAGQLPRLIERTDLRGDLHSHTTESDGKETVRAMAQAAASAGLEYLAITDHSQSLAMANGLDERRALAHAARIRAEDGRHGVRLLAGIECDIRPDGTLDLADDCLAALDIVVASVHSQFNLERGAMTDRLLRAIANPHVDILAHPTGRRLLRREPYAVDLEAVVKAAAAAGVALEINCQASRLDLSDVHARMAHDAGALIVISSDAHARAAFDMLTWGVVMARRAWLQPGDVLNTRSFEDFRSALRRHRSASR
jgi:DNA polymerase (family 10)